jgi:hypothetical protein
MCLPKFINSLVGRNQQIDLLSISMSYIGDKTLKQILNVTNMNGISQIAIDENHLTDDSLYLLFQQNFSKIIALSLKNN